MSITATLVPAAAGPWGGAAATDGGPAGRTPAFGKPGFWALAGEIKRQKDRGPATKVAHTRDRLTLSTPCLFLGILTAALGICGGARRLPVAGNSPGGTGQRSRIVPAGG